MQKEILLNEKTPNKKSSSLVTLSKETLDEALCVGIRDFENGNVQTAVEVKERLHSKYGL